ncbi:thermonuclease family protein [Patescibacteria group bacterium]|nr:thermonuclease family protein [Patescibacteria group bacterium]MBU4057357.1 thermonuclease family protein [Patescibacteria group bacterium]MBU4115725.1 thermonuclease family protein [Patescibacteria group bacterium]
MNIFLPKKVLVAGFGILILFIGVLIGMQFRNTAGQSPVLSKSKITNEKTNEANVQNVLEPQNKLQTETYKVTRVVDGDTIDIEIGDKIERVRYIGIDTPETVDPRKPVQCFGIEASKKNKELVEGKMVRLEKDITDRDKYNRLLRYVFVDDVFINLELVKQGFAYSYSYPPDIKHQDEFLKAQQEAEKTKQGLWSACPTEQEQTISTPTPTPTIENNNGECLIKGNISSTGEKIYHMIGCGSYRKTQIDESRGEKWFCTEAEAQSAGWRKALNCK